MKLMLIVSLFLGVFSSCDKKAGPEDVLKNYINYRFEQDQSKEELLAYLTGPVREKVEQMTPEDFKTFADPKNRRRGTFKILLKRCTDTKCSITYLLKYKESPAVRADQVEVKKIAEIDREEDGWKISDVSNIKTYISTDKSIQVSVPAKKE